MRRKEMEIKTDIQIAQENEMAHISQIAEKAGLAEEYVELYGNYKAKIPLSLLFSCAPIL